MRRALYLDTSAVLRATLEAGLSPEVEARIGTAVVLVTSRLALVESARAFLRARQKLNLSEATRHGSGEGLAHSCQITMPSAEAAAVRRSS